MYSEDKTILIVETEQRSEEPVPEELKLIVSFYAASFIFVTNQTVCCDIFYYKDAGWKFT